MPKYNTWIDPRAEVTRSQLRRIDIRDFAEKSARWALHLSEEEMAYLERYNPDSLGCIADPALYKAEWAKFINHPESKPFKVAF
jgi:hypothetical protein